MRHIAAGLLLTFCALALGGQPDTAEAVLKFLQNDDDTSRRFGCGYLYYLPAAELQKILNQKDLNLKTDCRHALNLAAMLAGIPQGVDYFADLAISQGPERDVIESWLLRRTTDEELAPLARKLRDRIKNPRGGREPWMLIANASGDPVLLHLTLETLLKINPRDSDRGRFHFDASATDAFMTELTQGTVERRLQILGLVRPGFSRGTGETIARLLGDPDLTIRRAAIEKLAFSSLPQALNLAKRAMSDRDPTAHSAACNAVVTFKGEEAVPLIKQLALSNVEAPFIRIAAWNAMAKSSDKTVIANAKTIVQQKNEDVGVRAAAAQYLVARSESQWLLENSAGLEMSTQSRVLADVTAANVPEAIAKIPAFLSKSDVQFATPVVQALGRQKSPAAIEALIEILKDSRLEIRRAASAALSSSTNVKAAEFPDEPGVRPEKSAAFLFWSSWYEHFGRPPSPDLQRQIDAIKQNVAISDNTPSLNFVDFDPVPALQRLALEHERSRQAIRILGSLQNPKAGEALAQMLDDPTFLTQQDEILKALTQRKPDPVIASKLIARLDDTRSNNRAQIVRVLLAWRFEKSADRIAEEVLSGASGERDLDELARWKPAGALARARAMRNDPKSGEAVRARAAKFLLAAGSEEDVKSLAVGLKTNASPAAIQAIIQLAQQGSKDAENEIKNALSNPDSPLSRQVLEQIWLHTEKNSGAEPTSEGLLSSVRSVLASAAADEPAGIAFTILAQSADVAAIPIIKQSVESGNCRRIGSYCEALSRVKNPAARALIEPLLTVPGLTAHYFRMVAGWYGTVLRMPETQRNELREAFLQRRDATFGQAVDGLQISFSMDSNVFTPGAKQVKGRVSFKNSSKESISLTGQSLSIEFSSPGGPMQEGFLSWPARLVQGKDASAVVAASGKSTDATISFDIPDDMVAPLTTCLLKVTLNTRRGGTRHDATAASSAWFEAYSIPDVWQKIEQRHGLAGK